MGVDGETLAEYNIRVHLASFDTMNKLDDLISRKYTLPKSALELLAEVEDRRRLENFETKQQLESKKD